jgi:hypothetical protein
MNSPFKMKPGRGSMQKTGRGIPTSLCSPNMQRKDAKTGKEVPEGAVYGNTVVSVDEYGNTVYTTPYKKKGTSTTTKKTYKQLAAEGGNVELAKKYNADVEGYVQRKSFPLPKAKPIQIDTKIEVPEIIVKNQKSPTPTPSTRSLTPTSTTEGYQTNTWFGKIKKASSNIIDNINIPSTNKKPKQGRCFTN